MRQLRILAAFGLLGAAAANAEVSSTWTLTNDYDFRGVSQSAKDPAIQGSIDYAADNGWYVGAWGSNVDFGDDIDVDLEVDLYTGFAGESEGGLGYDVGFVYYAYPDESDFDYMEIYGGLTKDWFEAKAWFSNDLGGDTSPGNQEGFYLEANGTFPLPQNFSILAHVGYAFGDYYDGSDEPIDYSLGVGYTVNKFDLALKYVDTETDAVTRDDVFNNEGRVIFSIATTFPWSNE